MQGKSGRETLGWLVELLRERALEAAAADPDEGLRARKKRLTRQLISDTATALFLERGFHEVRVAEVADAAGVSEKTVYNYFPTKEALVLDREEAIADQIRRALGPTSGARSPVQSAVELITHDVRGLFHDLFHRSDDPATRAEAAQTFRRFMDMVDETPELRAAQHEMIDRLVQVAAESLAARAGVDPREPEPQIAAMALVGLWKVQHQAMLRHLATGTDPDRAARLIVAEVRRAARLIDTGLWCFGALVPGAPQREELRAAAESVEEAVRQIVAAVRQARAVWRRHGH